MNIVDYMKDCRFDKRFCEYCMYKTNCYSMGMITYSNQTERIEGESYYASNTDRRNQRNYQ